MTDKITQTFRFGRAFIKNCPEIKKLEFKMSDNSSIELKLVNNEDFNALNGEYKGIPVYWGIYRGSAGVMIDIYPIPSDTCEIDITFENQK